MAKVCPFRLMRYEGDVAKLRGVPNAVACLGKDCGFWVSWAPGGNAKNMVGACGIARGPTVLDALRVDMLKKPFG